MNDETENSREEAASDEPRGPRGGERLAEARRAKQVSVLEIAKELHLDEYKVRALERNEFDVLGAPVFAKGHLKKYAQLVQVDPDDVLTDYYKLNRSASVPPVVSSRPKPRQEPSPGPWMAIIVIIVLLVIAYFWLTSQPLVTGPTTAPPQPEQSEPGVVEPADTDTGILQVPPATDAGIEREPQTPDTPVEQPVSEPVDAPAPAVGDGQMRMLLTFTGDCWTEITDANGRRLLFELGKDGRSVELSGAEPFNVLFGNPANVSVQVNGADFALPPANRPGRALRITIPGS